MKPTPIVRILAVLAVVIGLLVLMATLANAQPVQLTDDSGRQITLAQPPPRIVNLPAWRAHLLHRARQGGVQRSVPGGAGAFGWQLAGGRPARAHGGAVQGVAWHGARPHCQR